MLGGHIGEVSELITIKYIVWRVQLQHAARFGEYVGNYFIHSATLAVRTDAAKAVSFLEVLQPAIAEFQLDLLVLKNPQIDKFFQDVGLPGD